MKKVYWAFAYLLMLTTICVAAAVSDEIVTVQGIGYPPIRAQSAAQAHLMAKRAAVVDAYRNAVAASASGGQDVTYQELTGFVSNMTVVAEEYLKDGGIRIIAEVPRKSIVSSPGAVASPRGRKPDSSGGPQRVTVDEWYSIISSLVKIEK